MRETDRAADMRRGPLSCEDARMATKIDPPKLGAPRSSGTSSKTTPTKPEAAKAGSKTATSKAAPAKSAGGKGAAPTSKASPSAASGRSSAAAPASRRAAIRSDVKPIDRSKGEGRKLTEEELRKAAAEGRKIVAYAPVELEEFLRGYRTLGELEGISKAEQYRMAELGYRFLTEGKTAQGRDVFFGLVALDPFDAYFLTCLGSAHQQEKKTEEAERLYTRALEINPYQTTARTHRGELRAMSGRLQEAIEDLTRAVKDDPVGKDPAVKRAAVLLKAIESKLI